MAEAAMTFFASSMLSDVLSFMSETCLYRHVLYHMRFELMFQNEVRIIKGVLKLKYKGPGSIAQVRKSLYGLVFYHSELLKSGIGNFL
jgi:hypothetical protein